jgi:hypothetical protein
MPGKIYKLDLEVPAQALGSLLSSLKVDAEAWMRYPMTLEIPESDLGTVISQLVAAKIKLGDVKDTGKLDERKSERKSGYAGGIRNKGISGRDLILKIMGSESKVWLGNEFSKKFVENGFAGGSWAPPMSELTRENKVRALGRGRYVLPGYVLKPGD